MARAKLTTKTLAQRIDLDYFKHPHPFRRLRSVLSISIPLIAFLWLGWYALAHNNRVYSAGKMSSAHAVLTAKCSSCHVKEPNSFSAKATDQSCDSCHSAPFHHANQTFTPICASCHVEHRGHLRLAVTSDISCTQCHSNLHTIGTPTRFTAEITRFNGGHPEFAILRDGKSDPGTIKLNHAVHLKRNLRGPNGPVQLDCEDCHRTVRPQAGWRFGSGAAQDVSVAPTGIPPSMDASRAYMSPVTYAKHCSACHGLQFDARFQESVPHDAPEVIDAFLVHKFQQYIPDHPTELRVVAPHTEYSAKARTARRSRADATTVGEPSCGGIGRTALAEDLRAVPRVTLRDKCNAADRREVEHPSKMVSACGFQSRCAQIPGMRRMPCWRAEEPGNFRRPAAGNTNLRKVPSRWA